MSAFSSPEGERKHTRKLAVRVGHRRAGGFRGDRRKPLEGPWGRRIEISFWTHVGRGGAATGSELFKRHPALAFVRILEKVF